MSKYYNSRLANNNTIDRSNDAKIITWIIVGFLFIAWLCTPPGNKFLQMCFWGNNTKLFVAKITNNEHAKEYIFYRNNAVYLAKMYTDKHSALREMDKAFRTIPSYVPDSELESLYRDRANIRIMAGDYTGALNDFLHSGTISFNDNLKVALLFKAAGRYKDAARYCNEILNTDITAYAGYACLADVYSELGKFDVALKIWDLAIDKKPNNSRIYADRALLKQKMGDLDGYNSDIEKAKEISPHIRVEESILYDTMHPKVLNLTIR